MESPAGCMESPLAYGIAVCVHLSFGLMPCDASIPSSTDSIHAFGVIFRYLSHSAKQKSRPYSLLYILFIHDMVAHAAEAIHGIDSVIINSQLKVQMVARCRSRHADSTDDIALLNIIAL